MIRFFRWLLFIFGILIFALVIVRSIQPAQPTGIYQVIAADLHRQDCCVNYLISEETRTANRARLSGLLNVVGESAYSPSGDWRFVNLTISATDTIALMIPAQGGSMVRLPSPVEQYMHWSSYKDAFYYLRAERPFGDSALYRVTPSQTTPVRLTRDQFRWVSMIYEQPLPATGFSPYVLIFYSLGFLGLGGLLKFKETHHV
jgi:hypothetical protein